MTVKIGIVPEAGWPLKTMLWPAGDYLHSTYGGWVPGPGVPSPSILH